MSGRLQKPALVEASVRPRRRRAGVVVGQGRQEQLARAFAGPERGRLLMPRSVRSRTAAEGSVTAAAQDFHHLLAGFGDVDQGRPPEQRLDRLQSLAAESAAARPWRTIARTSAS